MVEAFKLTEDGDIAVSSNGVIQTIQNIDADLQSAIMLIASKKGSYAFIQDFGLDHNTIFDYRVTGLSADESIADITRYLIELELSKDPNFGSITNFDYRRVPGTRKLELIFDITLNGDVIPGQVIEV